MRSFAQDKPESRPSAITTEAASAVAGAAVFAAAGAAAGSVLPQAANATAATRDASNSDLFIFVLDRMG
jgi:hypothetical protein